MIPALPSKGVPEYTQKILVADESAAFSQAGDVFAVDESAELMIAATKQPFEVVGTGEEVVAGVHEATFVGHGVVDAKGAAEADPVRGRCAPEPEADGGVPRKGSGLVGRGTFRLSACGTGLPRANGVAYGQELAQVAALDAPTVVLAPQGKVGMGSVSGLPKVIPPGGKLITCSGSRLLNTVGQSSELSSSTVLWRRRRCGVSGHPEGMSRVIVNARPGVVGPVDHRRCCC